MPRGYPRGIVILARRSASRYAGSSFFFRKDSAMRIVGIIGPYISGGNRRLIDHNIANVQYLTIRIANHFAASRAVGFFAPHSHTARFERLAEAPEPYYHALDDELYDRACDAFIALPAWQGSRGATRDRARALERGKRVFELASWDEADVALLLAELEAWTRE